VDHYAAAYRRSDRALEIIFLNEEVERSLECVSRELNIVYESISYSLLSGSAVGAGLENKLAEKVKKIVPKMCMSGDCVDARTLLDATSLGERDFF